MGTGCSTLSQQVQLCDPLCSAARQAGHEAHARASGAVTGWQGAHGHAKGRQTERQTVARGLSCSRGLELLVTVWMRSLLASLNTG